MKKPIDAEFFNKFFTQMLEFPYPNMCIHYVILKLGTILEEYGYDQNEEFIKSVIKADDEIALTILKSNAVFKDF